MYAVSNNVDVGLSFLLRTALQRILRTFARFANRILAADLHVPPFWGTIHVLLLFFVCFLYSLVVGAYGNDISNICAELFGLQLKNIVFVSNKPLSKERLLEVLGVPSHAPMLTLDVQQLAQHLSALPFVEQVRVEKLYPDTCRIYIKKRVPFALWQHNGRFDVVDAAGVVIAPYRSKQGPSLPLIVGAGAQQAAQAFLPELAKISALTSRIKACVRVGGRRWDLLLKNGVVIKLPQDAPLRSLQKFFSLTSASTLLEKAVAVIDLRIKDRLIIQPQRVDSPEDKVVSPQGLEGSSVSVLYKSTMHMPAAKKTEGSAKQAKKMANSALPTDPVRQLIRGGGL